MSFNSITLPPPTKRKARPLLPGGGTVDHAPDQEAASRPVRLAVRLVQFRFQQLMGLPQVLPVAWEARPGSCTAPVGTC